MSRVCPSRASASRLDTTSDTSHGRHKLRYFCRVSVAEPANRHWSLVRSHSFGVWKQLPTPTTGINLTLTIAESTRR